MTKCRLDLADALDSIGDLTRVVADTVQQRPGRRWRQHEGKGERMLTRKHRPSEAINIKINVKKRGEVDGRERDVLELVLRLPEDGLACRNLRVKNEEYEEHKLAA